MVNFFMSNLKSLWNKLRGSYWFIPAVMSFLAGVAALLSLQIDMSNSSRILPAWARIFTGGSDGARSVLAVVAGSIITVAGVTFSISIVILSLAAQQYGPRLLRVFMRDRAIHFTFGMFISTFVYSLLILPTIHSSNGSEIIEFVPRFGVSVSIILAISCVFILIYFIHHIAFSIQPSYLISKTSEELIEAIHNRYPDKSPQLNLPERSLIEANKHQTFTRVPKFHLRARNSGYLQALNIESLTSLANRFDIFIEVTAKAGKYFARDDILLNIYGHRELDQAAQGEINRCFIFGIQKTLEQDLEFGFRILTEVAVRALSPSLNDPFTALQCLEYIREAFKILADKPPLSPYYFDALGVLRVLLVSPSWVDLLRENFAILHHYGKDTPIIIDGLAEMLRALARDTDSSDALLVFNELAKRLDPTS